jgi:WS/DGAT C-terminal domain
VPIYVPITLRPASLRDQARGNLTALMAVPLPVGVPGPGRRLREIAAKTARGKAESRPPVGTVFHGPMPRRVVLAVMSRQRVNLVSADFPGPPQPLYLAGARLLEVFPVLSLMAIDQPRRRRAVLRRTVQRHGRRRPRRLSRPRRLRCHRPRRTAGTPPPAQ